MLTPEQKEQFSDILEELGKSLDISKDQYDAAVRSYKHVGEWLAAEGSPLEKYSPEILPQGSFLLQTMIKPTNEDDELDIDLVCKLEKIQVDWTQFDLKKIVGDRLKANGILLKLLVVPDGRRCWTLRYADSAKFHLDVLPSIVVTGYKAILEKAFSASSFEDTQSLGIRITDKSLPNYKTSTNLREWMKSNPFGYAIWFENRAKTTIDEVRMLSDSVQPVPKYQTKKLPLQRVVQILKRHRDMMFNGDEEKPISIIITTLAAKAYRKETDIITALTNVIDQIPREIEVRVDPKTGKSVKWIPNPANPEENFADKWVENPRKEEKFNRWLTQVKLDIQSATGKRGLQFIQESLEKPFGKDVINKTFSNYGDSILKRREGGLLKMAAGSGVLSNSGSTTVKNHNFHGK
jgi:hypothetical protein